jgi:hypothetical protein
MDAAMNPDGPPTTPTTGDNYCNWNPVVGKNWELGI